MFCEIVIYEGFLSNVTKICCTTLEIFELETKGLILFPIMTVELIPSIVQPISGCAVFVVDKLLHIVEYALEDIKGSKKF